MIKRDKIEYRRAKLFHAAAAAAIAAVIAGPNVVQASENRTAQMAEEKESGEAVLQKNASDKIASLQTDDSESPANAKAETAVQSGINSQELEGAANPEKRYIPGDVSGTENSRNETVPKKAPETGNPKNADAAVPEKTPEMGNPESADAAVSERMPETGNPGNTNAEIPEKTPGTGKQGSAAVIIPEETPEAENQENEAVPETMPETENSGNADEAETENPGNTNAEIPEKTPGTEKQGSAAVTIPEETPEAENPENEAVPETMPETENPENADEAETENSWNANAEIPEKMPGTENPENANTAIPETELPINPAGPDEDSDGESGNGDPAAPKADQVQVPKTAEHRQGLPVLQAIPPRVSIENTPYLFHTIDKQYALVQVSTWLNVREGKGLGSRIVGTIPKGGICCIIADPDSDWIFIESGDVRGFVSAKYLLTGEYADREVKKNGEQSYSLGEEKIAPWDNAAYCYSYDTVRSAAPDSEFRNTLLGYAQNFLGNPYVWGGTSLTDGCDCSGFVQQIYAKFNYELPRTSREQAKAGERISDREAKPGDLLFYQTGSGYIYHVMLYLGNGKVIHASSEKTGIIISDYNYAKSAGYAVRVIKEEEQAITVNTGVNYIEPDGEFLGKFKLTAYCNCAECCGKWADGLTASGTVPTQARTVAMAGIPFGTKLNIGGQVFTVEDRGTPYGHVDIYMNLHSAADEFGVQYANVFIQK